MVKYIAFMDILRQQEIETFYKVIPQSANKACQMHRDYYRGYPKAHHPLSYFRDPDYGYQCPAEMSHVYLSYPAYHIKYKQPSVLAEITGPTSGLPPLPGRTLAARFNKAACKAYSR